MNLPAQSCPEAKLRQPVRPSVSEGSAFEVDAHRADRYGGARFACLAFVALLGVSVGPAAAADGGACVPRPGSPADRAAPVIGSVIPAAPLVLERSEQAVLQLALEGDATDWRLAYEGTSADESVASVIARPSGEFAVSASSDGSTTLTLAVEDASTGRSDSVTVEVVVAQSSPAAAGPAGIVFQSDFESDTGYVFADGMPFDGSGTPPTGFDSMNMGSTQTLRVTPEGRDGGNAMRFEYRGADRASMTLARHLSRDPNIGYDELYVRYSVKLPANFHRTAGQFWKWGRLWQNTSVEVDGTWTELREDAGYVVWGVGSGWQGKQTFYGAFADNDVPGNHALGSNGGPMQLVNWYRAVPDDLADGLFESVGYGSWDSGADGFLVDRNQSYHTIEWRFKLASSAAAEDGAFEMWIDGVPWIAPTYYNNYYSAPKRAGVPTVRDGSGWNYLSMFDNMQSWAKEWGRSDVDGYILIDDVVVSTDRIGHGYVPTGTTH